MNTTTVHVSPRDVFMHLFSVMLLYVSAGSFLTLLFQFVNAAFPDSLNPYFELNAVRWGIASLVVIFPVFLWVSRFINRDLAAHPEKSELRIRKWLLYLTLFAAAGFIIGDLIALIFRFLEGELTIRFALKVVAIFAVAACVFWYYLSELRRKPESVSAKRRISVWIISVTVAISVVAGFFIAGSPFEQRLVRFDDERVSDLQTIQNQIRRFWTQKGRLPKNLAELKDKLSGFVPPIDPEGVAAYEYRVTGSLSFELCAKFNIASPESSVPMGPKQEYRENWEHSAGVYCFNRIIDPELYPPQNGKIHVDAPGIPMN